MIVLAKNMDDKSDTKVYEFDESLFYRNDFTLKTWAKIHGTRYERISQCEIETLDIPI